MTVECEDGIRPMPSVKRACKRCQSVPSANLTPEKIASGYVIVSPNGIAHEGHDHDWRTGDTACGIDATGDAWWWPL